MTQDNGQTLKQKTVHGVAWSAVENFSNLGISFLFGLLLARLLSPSDYGVIAMITVFTAVAGCFVNSGFSHALVRKPGRTEADCATAFYFNLVVATGCYLLLFAAAPLIARFYHMPLLTSVVRVMGLGLIINALCIVQQALLTARIDFKTQAKISLSSNVVSGVIGVGFAYAGYGVWALVIQGVLGGTFRTVILWVLAKWRPRGGFSRASFRYLFGFGSKLLASSLLDTLWNNVYPLIIGRLFSPATLGLYTRAYGFAQLPSSNVTGIIQRVTFPVLATIQDDKARLANDYRRLLRMSGFVIFPLMVTLAGVADPLVRFLITDKWAGCIPLLQIVCFGMMWYPVHAINLNLLTVTGRSDLFLKLEVAKKVVGIVVLAVSYRWGVVGMCYGSVVSSLVCVVINTYYTGKLIGVGYLRQMGDLTPTLLRSLAAGGAALACSMWMPGPYIVRLAVAGMAAATVYIGSAWMMHSPELEDLKNIRKR